MARIAEDGTRRPPTEPEEELPPLPEPRLPEEEAEPEPTGLPWWHPGEAEPEPVVEARPAWDWREWWALRPPEPEERPAWERVDTWMRQWFGWIGERAEEASRTIAGIIPVVEELPTGAEMPSMAPPVRPAARPPVMGLAPTPNEEQLEAGRRFVRAMWESPPVRTVRGLVGAGVTGLQQPGYWAERALGEGMLRTAYPTGEIPEHLRGVIKAEMEYALGNLLESLEPGAREKVIHSVARISGPEYQFPAAQEIAALIEQEPDVSLDDPRITEILKKHESPLLELAVNMLWDPLNLIGLGLDKLRQLRQARGGRDGRGRPRRMPRYYSWEDFRDRNAPELVQLLESLFETPQEDWGEFIAKNPQLKKFSLRYSRYLYYLYRLWMFGSWGWSRGWRRWPGIRYYARR